MSRRKMFAEPGQPEPILPVFSARQRLLSNPLVRIHEPPAHGFSLYYDGSFRGPYFDTGKPHAFMLYLKLRFIPDQIIHMQTRQQVADRQDRFATCRVGDITANLIAASTQ